MNPFFVVIFAPVILGGLAFFAILIDAAVAGGWEAVEERPVPVEPRTEPAHVFTERPSHVRAA